jgi:hypothetical protein
MCAIHVSSLYVRNSCIKLACGQFMYQACMWAIHVSSLYVRNSCIKLACGQFMYQACMCAIHVSSLHPPSHVGSHANFTQISPEYCKREVNACCLLLDAFVCAHVINSCEELKSKCHNFRTYARTCYRREVPDLDCFRMCT